MSTPAFRSAHLAAALHLPMSFGFNMARGNIKRSALRECSLTQEDTGVETASEGGISSSRVQGQKDKF